MRIGDIYNIMICCFFSLLLGTTAPLNMASRQALGHRLSNAAAFSSYVSPPPVVAVSNEENGTQPFGALHDQTSSLGQIKKGDRSFDIVGPILQKACREAELTDPDTFGRAKEAGLIVFDKDPNGGFRYGINPDITSLVSEYMNVYSALPQRRKYLSYGGIFVSTIASGISAYLAIYQPQSEIALPLGIASGTLSIIASSQEGLKGATIEESANQCLSWLAACITTAAITLKAATDIQNTVTNPISDAATDNQNTATRPISDEDNKILNSFRKLLTHKGEIIDPFVSYLTLSSFKKKHGLTGATKAGDEFIIRENADNLRYKIDEGKEEWGSHARKARTFLFSSGLGATIVTVVWVVLHNIASENLNPDTKRALLAFQAIMPVITGLTLLSRLWMLFIHHMLNEIGGENEALIQLERQLPECEKTTVPSQDSCHMSRTETNDDGQPAETKQRRGSVGSISFFARKVEAEIESARCKYNARRNEESPQSLTCFTFPPSVQARQGEPTRPPSPVRATRYVCQEKR